MRKAHNPSEADVIWAAIILLLYGILLCVASTAKSHLPPAAKPPRKAKGSSLREIMFENIHRRLH